MRRRGRSVLLCLVAAGVPLSGRAVGTPMPMAVEQETGRPAVLLGYTNPNQRVSERQRALYLTGAWTEREGWQAIPDRPLPTAWQASSWRLYPSLRGAAVALRGQPKPRREDDETEPHFLLLEPATGGVAVTSAVAARPRLARALPHGSVALASATRELLRRYGLTVPAQPRITGAWEVDLDGDGRREQLWTARSRDVGRSPYLNRKLPGHALPSDYALVGLRYRSGPGWEVVALQAAGPVDAAADYTVCCPLDLNGDGRLEVLAHARYYEEATLLTFTLDGRRVRSILGTPGPGRYPASSGCRD